MGWQWHQLDHMQIICISLQTDNHASTLPLSFFYRSDALPATQPTASKQWRQKLIVNQTYHVNYKQGQIRLHPQSLTSLICKYLKVNNRQQWWRLVTGSVPPGTAAMQLISNCTCASFISTQCTICIEQISLWLLVCQSQMAYLCISDTNRKFRY